jgi:DNA topoisomerase I
VSRSLVIVESPAKAKTINHFLGSGFIVKASMGHVRDLPKSKLGVDVDHDFEPTYQIIPDKKKIVAELKKLAKESDRVILAADPDREGEAISWHLSELIREANPNIFRAVFNEITEEGVKKAFDHIGGLDLPKIEAQQTRRILDRLVGYTISPLLWKKIGRGLSAGRVQSVALRLICDREKEIRAFVAEEFWNITARFKASAPPEFKAALAKIDGKKAKVENKDQADGILADCRTARFVLETIKVEEKKKTPAPPYITSSLQQDGFRLLHFPVKKTMFVAQKLYEGLAIGDLGQTGLITYMRTDSFRISDEARGAAKAYIERTYSPSYVPSKPNSFKNKKKAQDAHEAIRPAHLDMPPDRVKPFLKKEEFDLYRLIWNRFLASQMAPAVVEETDFDIRAGRYLFRAKGEVMKFDGFLAAFPNGGSDLDDVLPKAFEGEVLALVEGEAGLEAKQSFTQPPARYTEGTLVKELEAKGIGRPSTYAPILSTLQDRVYVVREKGKFIPTDLGMFVTDFLVKYFAELLDLTFTAQMEEELDLIGEGELPRIESLRKYYALLVKYMKAGNETEDLKKSGVPVDDKCPKCGKNLVIKSGRFGPFKACSGYPDCSYKESLVKKESKPLDEKCPQCGAPLVVKFGRFGSFIACSDYPKCKYIHKEKLDTGIPCPMDCGGTLIRRKTRRGKFFYGCGNFPKCKFATWDEPVNKPCPVCGKKFVLRKNLVKGDPYLHCQDEKCTYKEVVPREKLWEQGKEAPAPPSPEDEKTD